MLVASRGCLKSSRSCVRTVVLRSALSQCFGNWVRVNLGLSGLDWE